MDDKTKREVQQEVRKTVDGYVWALLIGFAIAGGFFWPVLGAVLALTAAVAVPCFAWYGVQALRERVRRWQAMRDSRAEIARRRTLGY